MPDHTSTPLLSVIVAVPGGADGARRCLEALAASTLAERVEAIVVHGGDAAAGPFEGGALDVRVAAYPGAPAGALRNRGAEMARSAVLAFLDPECEPAPAWIEQVLRASRQYGGVVTAACAAEGDAGNIAAVWSRHQGRCPAAASLAVSRADFAEIGGFDDALASRAAAEFCRRAATLGFAVRRDEGIAVRFPSAPRTLAALARHERHAAPVLYGAYIALAVAAFLPAAAAAFFTGIHALLLAPLAGIMAAPLALSASSVFRTRRWSDFAPLSFLLLVSGVASAAGLCDVRAMAVRLRHPLVRNAAALYAQQVAAYVLPIVTIPYLARVLRPDAWGMVVFAQGFAMWLSRVLEYGFNLSATRQVARRRSDPRLVGDIVAGVLGAQMMLAAVAGTVAAVAAVAVPSFRQFPLYLLLAWLSSVAQGFNPLWFYQGSEDMRLPAALNVAGRVASTAGIFILVNGTEDGWLVLALQVATGWISSGLAIGLIYRRVPAVLPRPARAWAALREGWRVFLLRGSITLYSTANTFLLGLFVPSNMVAYYGGAERISRACYDSLSPVSQSLFPHMAHLASADRKRAVRVARASFFVLGGIGLAACAGLMIFAPLVVRLLLGREYQAAIPVLRVLSLVTPIAAVSNLLGVQWMVPLGLERQMNHVIIAAGVINLTLVPLLAPRYGALGMACAVVTAEATVTVGMYLTLRRLRLDPFGRQREALTAEAAPAVAGARPE